MSETKEVLLCVQVGADGAEAGGEVRGHLRRYDLTQALGAVSGQEDGYMRPR